LNTVGNSECIMTGLIHQEILLFVLFGTANMVINESHKSIYDWNHTGKLVVLTVWSSGNSQRWLNKLFEIPWF